MTATNACHVVVHVDLADERLAHALQHVAHGVDVGDRLQPPREQRLGRVRGGEAGSTRTRPPASAARPAACGTAARACVPQHAAGGGERHDQHEGDQQAAGPGDVDAERERDEDAGTSPAAASAGTPTRRCRRAARGAATGASEQPVEPAALDVAREVHARRRAGEARALEHAHRDDERAEVRRAPSPGKPRAPAPNTPVRPIMKIVGARTPGIAPPGTRRISLSARRDEREDRRAGSGASVMRRAAFRAARRRDARRTRARRRGAAARPSSTVLGARSRDDRVAHALGDVAERVVVGEPARRRLEQARAGRTPSETNRITKTSGKIPWTVEAFLARKASSIPIAPKPIAGDDGDAGHEEHAGQAADDLRAEDQADEQEPQRLEDGEHGRRRAGARGRAPRAGRATATSRSKKPPSMLERGGDPGAVTPPSRIDCVIAAASWKSRKPVTSPKPGSVVVRSRPPTFTARNSVGKMSERREELRAAERVAQRAPREREDRARHAATVAASAPGRGPPAPSR